MGGELREPGGQKELGSNVGFRPIADIGSRSVALLHSPTLLLHRSSCVGIALASHSFL